MQKIGVLVGETRPLSAIMVSKRAPRVGDYVFVTFRDERGDQRCLALVQRVWRANPFLDEGLTDPEHATRIMEMERWDSFFKAELSIVGQVAEGRLSLPKSPPLPGAEVFPADSQGLREVLGAEDPGRWARIGTLLGSDVPVSVDIDQLVLRHLAVLAVTGGGKSNAVGVILEQIAQRSGTSVVMDPHGEYGAMGNRIAPVINPLALSVDEIAGLLGVDMSKSSIQYYMLYLAWQEIREELRKSNIALENKGDEFDAKVGLNFDYFERLTERIRALAEQKENEDGLRRELARKHDSLFGLLIRIDNLRNNLGHLFNNEARALVNQIIPGRINALDLSGLDQDAMDVVASHLLRHILRERKNALAGREVWLQRPVFVVIEEAHLFCPDREWTRTKRVASRIAREGRKFGLGLAIVSQRPKRLDPDVLSQMNNMIILRIVEPGDQRHIAEASENLSGELTGYLASLNPGEALCLGPGFRIPLLVKLDEAKNKPSGRDLPVTGAWAERESMTDEEAQGLYG